MMQWTFYWHGAEIDQIANLGREDHMRTDERESVNRPLNQDRR